MKELLEFIDKRYPFTFINSETGKMERGSQESTCIRRLDPWEKKMLDNLLEFIYEVK